MRIGPHLVLIAIGVWFFVQGAESFASPTYPYEASPKRQQQIKDGFKRIKPGMTVAEVKAILGDPDEIRPLLQPSKKAKRKGTTYWYLLFKKEKERCRAGDKIVRVAFDLQGKVTRVRHWGFDDQ
jgi:hypothetical protein